MRMDQCLLLNNSFFLNASLKQNHVYLFLLCLYLTLSSVQLSKTQTTIIHHRVIDTIVDDDKTDNRDHPDQMQVWSFHLNNYQDFQENPSSIEIGK